MAKRSSGRHRLDFVEVPVVDPRTGRLSAVLVPDPTRYEPRDVQGKPHLFDRLENVLINLESLHRAMAAKPDVPIYDQAPLITNPRDYVVERAPQMLAHLDGAVLTEPCQDKSEEFLASLEADQQWFVILVLDLAGSTRLSQVLAPVDYARLISTLLYETSRVVPGYHGHVLKYAGDGLIAYFPAPSFISMHDLAFQCAVTLRHLVYAAMNPALTTRRLPTIDIRIGIESGEAAVLTLGSATTKRHRDLIGAVVNLASKIQGLASPGSCLLGHYSGRNLHTVWRTLCTDATPKTEWYMHEGQPYRLLKADLEGALALWSPPRT